MNLKSSERGFDRGSWLVLAGVTFFVLMVLTTTFLILRLPGDGWQIDYADFDIGNYALDNYIGDWVTPLKPGDVVTAIDGHLLPENVALSPLEAPENWGDGGTVTYTIQRDGKMMDVSVKLHRLGWRGMLSGLAYTMVDELPQWSWFLAGLFIFVLRPKNQAARLLFIAGASIAVVTKIGWAATMLSLHYVSPIIWYTYFVISFFWGLLFYPSLILLLLRFPFSLWPLTRYPRQTVWLVYVVPLLLASLTIFLEETWPALIVLAGEAVLIFAAAGGAIIQVFRQKHNRVARAQVSWVAMGVAISIGGTLVVYLVGSFGLPVEIETFVRAIVSWPVALALPFSLSIAILRYRLFDIDFLIRRTLSYTILTGILGLIYFGGVVLLQNIFLGLSGSAETPLITVISTLTIAALFNPLRTRVQDFIDRRFYRQKYNAERILADFSAAARDEVDLAALSSSVLQVVADTLQPERAGLWLKVSDRSRARPSANSERSGG